MEKKNRPVQQAANSDIRTSDITPPTSRHKRHDTPKKHRARVYMLRTGVEDGQKTTFCATAVFHLAELCSELERQLDIQLERIDEKNPDGIGAHLRYRFPAVVMFSR
jgi:hypothetical protein